MTAPSFQAVYDVPHEEQLLRMIEDARLLRSYAAGSSRSMPDAFVPELGQATEQLAQRLRQGEPPAPAGDPLVELEKRFLPLYDKLAAAMLPVTAYSIRHTQWANRKRVFLPTLVATVVAIVVFGLMVALQGYWVVGKRFRDLVQRQDTKRQELIVKNASIEDAMALVKQRMAGLPEDCESPAEIPPRTKAVSDPPALDHVKRCALKPPLEEELFRLQLNQRPIEREQKDIADQFRPVIAVLTSWYTISAWLNTGKDWTLPFEKEIEKIQKEADAEREALKATPLRTSMATREPASGAVQGSTYSPSALGRRLQARMIDSHEEKKIREIEQSRSRVLIHRIDVVLEIVQNYLVPALLGLLGALIFVLRDIGTKLRNYAYVPDSLSRGVVRIVVGAMAGVLGGWFIPSADSVAKSIPPLVIPFLFGYSVELLFGVLDKAVGLFKANDPAAPARPTS